jgi:L-iditol 2-dehydrogenase
MMALKAMGVSKVYMVDIMEKRLQKAMELGADGVINGACENVVKEVRRLTGGKGCDLAVETAGTETTTVQTIHMTKKGAVIVLVGYSKSGEMTLPLSLALDKELTFKTVFRYRHIYPMAIEAVASGRVNLKGIVTDLFDLDEAQKAMDYSVNHKADIVKAVIRIG